MHVGKPFTPDDLKSIEWFSSVGPANTPKLPLGVLASRTMG